MKGVKILKQGYLSSFKGFQFEGCLSAGCDMRCNSKLAVRCMFFVMGCGGMKHASKNHPTLFRSRTRDDSVTRGVS